MLMRLSIVGGVVSTLSYLVLSDPVSAVAIWLFAGMTSMSSTASNSDDIRAELTSADAIVLSDGANNVFQNPEARAEIAVMTSCGCATVLGRAKSRRRKESVPA